MAPWGATSWPSRVARPLATATPATPATPAAPAAPPAEVSRLYASADGVLELTLRAGGYDWRFVPEAGKTFTDSGSATCH